MLSFLSNTRVYLAAGATDLRRSFDTLTGVVRDSLCLDPLSGHLFVFMLPVRRASPTRGVVGSGLGFLDTVVEGFRSLTIFRKAGRLGKMSNV